MSHDRETLKVNKFREAKIAKTAAPALSVKVSKEAAEGRATLGQSTQATHGSPNVLRMECNCAPAR